LRLAGFALLCTLALCLGPLGLALRARAGGPPEVESLGTVLLLLAGPLAVLAAGLLARTAATFGAGEGRDDTAGSPRPRTVLPGLLFLGGWAAHRVLAGALAVGLLVAAPRVLGPTTVARFASWTGLFSLWAFAGALAGGVLAPFALVASSASDGRVSSPFPSALARAGRAGTVPMAGLGAATGAFACAGDVAALAAAARLDGESSLHLVALLAVGASVVTQAGAWVAFAHAWRRAQDTPRQQGLLSPLLPTLAVVVATLALGSGSVSSPDLGPWGWAPFPLVAVALALGAPGARHLWESRGVLAALDSSPRLDENEATSVQGRLRLGDARIAPAGAAHVEVRGQAFVEAHEGGIRIRLPEGRVAFAGAMEHVVDGGPVAIVGPLGRIAGALREAGSRFPERALFVAAAPDSVRRAIFDRGVARAWRWAVTSLVVASAALLVAAMAAVQTT